MFVSFARVIVFAFQDMMRNLSLSLMTVLILVLMLLSMNTLLAIQIVTQEATRLVKEQIDVSIFFSHDAPEEKITEVRGFMDQFPEVKETVYYSAEDVLAQFKAQYEDNPDILASLDELGTNPLGPTLVVRTNEPRDYQKIIDALQVPEYEGIIEAKTFQDTETAISRIDTITGQIEQFSLGILALFAIIAFLIIFNTVRVAIYTHRMEIGIKKLVGASNWFVRGPYLVEAVIFTIASVAISLVLVFFALSSLDPYVDVVFESNHLLTNAFQANILSVLGVQFGAVLLLTTLTSFLATRRYLRV